MTLLDSLLTRAVLQVTNQTCYEQSGDMYRCMVTDMNSAFGGAEFMGLIAGGAFLIAFYVASDFDPTVPPVATTLFGALLIPALPAAYTGVGTTMVVLGFVFGVFVAAQRYVLQVGT